MKQQYFLSSSLFSPTLLRGLFILIFFALFSSSSYSQCPGNQNTSPNNSWRGYLYDSANFTNYRGYTNEPEQFEWDYPGFLWWVTPFEGSNLCDELSINYSVRYRMTKNFTAGYYTFTVGADDGYRLSVDNGATWLINEWVTDYQYDTTTATVYLDGTKNLILEYFQALGNARLSFSYTACTSTAPSSIAGNLCSGTGGTTLSAVGGNLGSGGIYQWGTGTVPGANIVNSGQWATTYYVNPAVATTYWLRIFNTQCNTATSAVFATVSKQSTAPNYIQWIPDVCSGVPFTLNALGGNTGTNGTFQWGTGAVGTNIIAGANSSSLTTSQTANTTYWARRVDGAPCNSATNAVTFNVTVTASSTAPTSMTSSSPLPLCVGSGGTTLTAVGGTAAAGVSYQWGTGSVAGSNVLMGQSGTTLYVNPTTTTTYWVRRYQASCNSYTSAATFTVTVGSMAGNPATFGTNSWNVYGYTNGDLSLASAVYAGYYTQNTLGFDTLSGINSWGNSTSPSSAAGWVGCPVPVDNFTTVHKRKGFPCGTYALTMQLWDDSSVVYIDGVQQWSCNNWSGANTCNGVVGTFNLGPNTEIEVRTREITGLAGTTLNIVDVSVAPTAPTTLSSAGSICLGSSITLTANGGTNGTSGVFQWGTGSTGSNIISGETGPTITVTPTQTTNYWVRRINTVCGTTTNAKTRNITVNAAPVAGILSTQATEICRNTAPKDIILSGHVGNVIRWQSCNNASFSGGVSNINTTSTVLTSAEMGTINSTKYYRAVIGNNPCSNVTTAPIQITVPSVVTYAAGIWIGGIPGPANDVIIATNLTLSSDLEVCSCKVTGIATVTVPANVTLTVKKDIDISILGRIIVKDDGSLVQIDNNNTNSGSITVQRKTTPMKQYDYTYWSAPVQNMTLTQLSPSTLFDKFHSFDPIINNWQTILNGVQQMQPATGYIVRAPQGWSMTNATNGIYEATFDGPPNNGIVPVNLIKGATTLNLIGNPYPSAIDIDLFLTDPINESLVEGTIYLWTHNTALNPLTQGPAYANYSANDYAKYNLTGGVSTSNASTVGGEVPTGKIASGQSFFIEANPTLANGTYPGRFTNEMRIASNNGQFFRSATSSTPSPEKSRLWLSIENAAGSYNEMLVGYVAGATDEFDRKYDGKTFEAGNPVGIYSLLGETKLSIQGRALPFNPSEIIPLGFKTTAAGNNTITLEDADGIFGSHQTFLVDKQTGTTHDLHSGSYTFTSPAGTFHNRFELHFVSELLDVESHEVNDFAIATTNRSIQLRSGNRSISNVTVFDITGKNIFAARKINDSLYSTPALNISDQVLMVTIEFEDGHKITRKVIIE